MEKLIDTYFDLLSKWNRKINLISVGGREEFVDKHVEDVRVLAGHMGNSRRVLDLGTGAGIPGVILKIMKDDLDVTILDSTRKKISFCDEAIRQLGLKGIRAIWGRAEDPEVLNNLGTFDCVVSRATWELKKFLAIAAPFCREGGMIIAMKGPKWREELNEAKSAIEKIPLALEETHVYQLSGGEGRCLLGFRNITAHPKRPSL